MLYRHSLNIEQFNVSKSFLYESTVDAIRLKICTTLQRNITVLTAIEQLIAVRSWKQRLSATTHMSLRDHKLIIHINHLVSKVKVNRI